MADPSDIPPLDELPGWPMPEAATEWYGAPEVETTLLRAYRSQRLHHAWLFAGIKGIGKATLAFRFARFILAHPDPTTVPTDANLDIDPESRAFRQVAAGSHPNLLVLRRPWDDQTKRYRTVLTVEEVRRIQSFFGTTAVEKGWRICIVDTADELNINAANALLKMLEEPPENGLFLLIANRPGQLLPTIRSRCHRLDLKPLQEETIRRALAENEAGASAADIELAAALSGGSLRRAIQYLDSDGTATYRAFADLAGALPKVDYERVHALADSIAGRGQEDAFDGFVGLVDDWLSRRVNRRAEPAGSLSPAVEGASLASWAAVWEKLRDASLQAETLNLDRKQVVLQVFMALADATRM
jgi:DNA polymerase-3 subunit delta'